MENEVAKFINLVIFCCASVALVMVALFLLALFWFKIFYERRQNRAAEARRARSESVAGTQREIREAFQRERERNTQQVNAEYFRVREHGNCGMTFDLKIRTVWDHLNEDLGV